MIIKCCKDCNDREIGCHGKCERYIKEKEENDKYREAERKRNMFTRADKK